MDEAANELYRSTLEDAVQQLISRLARCRSVEVTSAQLLNKLFRALITHPDALSGPAKNLQDLAKQATLSVDPRSVRTVFTHPDLLVLTELNAIFQIGR